MATLQISLHLSSLGTTVSRDFISKTSCLALSFLHPTKISSLPVRKIGSLHVKGCRLRAFLYKGEILLRDEQTRKRVMVARVNQGFDFNDGGGGKDNGNTVRIFGNLALAIGLTYLSMTGQLGWLLDAIVSIWVLVVILTIVGLAAFLWFAGRDIVQDTCPNCGNDFQIFKSSLKDGVQLCPFCSQPFSGPTSSFRLEIGNARVTCIGCVSSWGMLELLLFQVQWRELSLATVLDLLQIPSMSRGGMYEWPLLMIFVSVLK